MLVSRSLIRRLQTTYPPATRCSAVLPPGMPVCWLGGSRIGGSCCVALSSRAPRLASSLSRTAAWFPAPFLFLAPDEIGGDRSEQLLRQRLQSRSKRVHNGELFGASAKGWRPTVGPPTACASQEAEKPPHSFCKPRASQWGCWSPALVLPSFLPADSTLSFKKLSPVMTIMDVPRPGGVYGSNLLEKSHFAWRKRVLSWRLMSGQTRDLARAPAGLRSGKIYCTRKQE